jgi:hypothetical protein
MPVAGAVDEMPTTVINRLTNRQVVNGSTVHAERATGT